MTKRFSIQIRNADNTLIKVESGYETRESAEKMAGIIREQVAAKGWNYSVYVHEEHEVRK